MRFLSRSPCTIWFDDEQKLQSKKKLTRATNKQEQQQYNSRVHNRNNSERKIQRKN